MIRIVVVLCVGIVALDAVEFAILRATGHSPFVWLSLTQVLVYIGLGFYFRRCGAQLQQVVALAAVTAFADASFDRAIMTWYGADTGSFGVWFALVPFTVLFQGVLVVLGFGLGSIGRAEVS